ncbi:MAG TPA: translation initiation factor IF-3 [Patescibacteria group bacterium]|nr:translation initiation factor IF-3 [Patescibacteria group bacterium]
MPKVFFKVNQFIQAPQMRVIDEFGKQVGLLTKAEAIAKANELGQDLVEIAPNANPPVVKMISFSKFKYQLQQKKQEDRKKSKISDLKEIWFTPFIAKGDFDTRIKKAIEYLKDGDKVRLVVKYQGRQITRKDFGDAVFARALEALDDYAKVESAPKLVGKQAFMQLMPAKKKKIIENEEDKE